MVRYQRCHSNRCYLATQLELFIVHKKLYMELGLSKWPHQVERTSWDTHIRL